VSMVTFADIVIFLGLCLKWFWNILNHYQSIVLASIASAFAVLILGSLSKKIKMWFVKPQLNISGFMSTPITVLDQWTGEKLWDVNIIEATITNKHWTRRFTDNAADCTIECQIDTPPTYHGTLYWMPERILDDSLYKFYSTAREKSPD